MRDADRIFDGLAERFARTIYGSVKGEVRLAILWRDLQEAVPALSAPAQRPLSILDIGGGIGQFSCRLAGLGHRVTLVEPSRDMIELARRHWRDLGEELTAAQTIPARWQDLPALALSRAPLVLFHAVMEWLAEPLLALRTVGEQVEAGGFLSVLFYNANAVIQTHLLRGNFDVVRSGLLGSQGKTLTPLRPLYPQAVIDTLETMGFEIVLHSGVRTFSDHADPRAKENIKDLVAMELAMSRKPPFRDMARYVHLLCRKPSS